MRKLDLTGQRYGKLTVLSPAPKKGKHTCWICRCECGNETVVSTDNLRSGHTTSCGRCREFINEGDFWRCITPGGKSFLFDEDDFETIKNIPGMWTGMDMLDAPPLKTDGPENSTESLWENLPESLTTSTAIGRITENATCE